MERLKKALAAESKKYNYRKVGSEAEKEVYMAWDKYIIDYWVVPISPWGKEEGVLGHVDLGKKMLVGHSG